MNRSFAVLSLALLLLTGCSGADKSQDAASSASATSSASASASAGNSGSAESSSGQADASSTSTEAKPAPTFGPNHQELELTAEEQAAYQAGEYVPATEKHPALNVPVPVMPEKAKERSYEGATAFVQYWIETANYSAQTGNTEYERAVISSEWESRISLLNTFTDLYRNGKWLEGSLNTGHIENGFILEHETLYDTMLVLQRDDGMIHSIDGSSSEKEPGNNPQGNQKIITLEWVSGKWKVVEISGLEGVSYD